MSRLTDSNKEIPLLINERYWLDIYFKLKEYEDLEEQGLLLNLPCKIGTTVYDIRWWDNITKKVKVDGETYYKTVCKHKVSKTKFSLHDYDDIGKEVFLTKEEAEQELKRLERKNENRKVMVTIIRERGKDCGFNYTLSSKDADYVGKVIDQLVEFCENRNIEK